jgi:hypothetical protein
MSARKHSIVNHGLTEKSLQPGQSTSPPPPDSSATSSIFPRDCAPAKCLNCSLVPGSTRTKHGEGSFHCHSHFKADRLPAGLRHHHSRRRPKLLFYFLVGIVFGATAYLTNSTLPAIPVHFVGLLIFFTVIWPRDAARPVVADVAINNWFWIHLAQAIVFTVLTLWAFQHLARVGTREVTSAANELQQSQTDSPSFLRNRQ